MANDRILTLEQAAELLQVHYETVRRWMVKGEIPGRKIGRGWRIVESDLKRWISEGQAERLAKRESAVNE